MNDPAPRLRISRRSGKVRVTADPGVPVSVDGGTLETHADGWVEIHSTGSSTLEVKCPTGSDLTISTSSGAIEVRGEVGSVKVTTKSGNLEIERASAIDARGASGKVEVGACAGECHVVFVSGKVHIGEAGKAVVATVSGNIEAGEVDDAEVKTVSGDIELGARGGGRLTARSISGSVKISVPDGDQPATHLRSLSGRISCECADGNNGEIAAKTVSGRIKVTCR
jgi:DUF4097 and DUF4098 domain-containing protein YvlB